MNNYYIFKCGNDNSNNNNYDLWNILVPTVSFAYFITQRIIVGVCAYYLNLFSVSYNLNSKMLQLAEYYYSLYTVEIIVINILKL